MQSGAWSHGGHGLILPDDAGSHDWRLERLPVILVAAMSARYAGIVGGDLLGLVVQQASAKSGRSAP